jgi:hypothetical protein
VVKKISIAAFAESSKDATSGRRQAKVPHQRRTQAENESQRRDKVSPLQNEG